MLLEYAAKATTVLSKRVKSFARHLLSITGWSTRFAVKKYNSRNAHVSDCSMCCKEQASLINARSFTYLVLSSNSRTF